MRYAPYPNLNHRFSLGDGDLAPLFLSFSLEDDSDDEEDERADEMMMMRTL